MVAIAREIIDDFSGGANLRGAPLRIGKNDLLSLMNMYPVEAGYLVGRGGQTDYGTIDANPVRSLYRFYKQSGQGILLATSGTIVAKGNDGAGTFTQIDSGYSTAQRFSFTSWSAKDAAYWVNGTLGQAAKKYDGASVTSLGGSPPPGIQIEFHQDRLWILLDDQIAFTDLNTDNSWPGAARLNIADAIGGKGRFLKSANQVLIAGKTSGLFRFEGSPLLGGKITKYSDVGCVSGATADKVTVLSNGQSIPVGVVFLSNFGVCVTDGYTVQLISDKIDPLFNPTDAPKLYFRDAVGKFYPKLRQYFLSFSPINAPNSITWVGTNIDIAGSKIAWSLYPGVAIDSAVVLDGGTDNGELYFGRPDVGTVKKFDVGSQDTGIDYTCELTSRYLDFHNYSANKQVRWINATFDAVKAVHYLINYFDEQQISGPLSAEVSGALIWDEGQWDVGEWAGPSLTNTRTSILGGKYGQFASINIQNTGDGPAFKFYQTELTARIKDRRYQKLFTLNEAI